MSEEQAPSRLWVLERLLDGLEEASRQIKNLLLHHSDLLEDIYIVGRQVSEPGQIGDSFVNATFGEQPTRRFLEKQTSDEQKSGRDQLHSERNEPLLLACWQCLDHSVVDPEPY